MSTESFERESRLADNFSKVPHGLWTCDLSHGAKCLLGWLHSHTSTYLATLTIGRIRREFGSGGSIARWLSELEQAGFVVVIAEKNRHRYRLRAAPWDALATRVRTPDETSHNGTTRNRTSRNRTETIPEWDDNRPEMDNIEDHVEDQGAEQQFFPAATQQDPPTVTARDITGDYVDTFAEVHGARPPAQSVKRVAQAAKQLLDEGRSPDLVRDAARDAAAGGHANLAASVTYLLARKSKRVEPRSWDALRDFLDES